MNNKSRSIVPAVQSFVLLVYSAFISGFGQGESGESCGEHSNYLHPYLHPYTTILYTIVDPCQVPHTDVRSLDKEPQKLP